MESGRAAKLTFYMLDHPLLPTPYNFRFTVEKFADGFAHNGWEVRVVRRVREIREPGVVMLANHDCFHGWAEGPLQPLFGRIPAIRSGTRLTTRPGRAGQRRVLRQLGRQLRERPGIVAVAWLWHSQEPLFQELGIPTIFTGECCWCDPETPGRQVWRAFNLRRPNALPLEFGAAVDPERIGEGCENEGIDCCYVGASTYREDWQAHFRADPRNRIIGTPPWVEEAERLDILRNSKIVLGLSQPGNVGDCVPVERVYEALAYGGVLITDMPAAVEATEGIGQYAGSLDEAQSLVDHYLANEGERRELRERGFDFARRRGTYAHRAAQFIALREQLLTGESTRPLSHSRS
jgi:hypothetical protein